MTLHLPGNSTKTAQAAVTLGWNQSKCVEKSSS